MGSDAVIFVTVGTTQFPFDRLLKAVDKAMTTINRGEKLVVQGGRSNYRFEYPQVEVFREVLFNKFIDYFKKARVVVTHGGPATVLLALKHGKNKPLVVPRVYELGEHVDDHEIFFGRFLEKRKGLKVVFPQEDLTLKIREYFKSPKKILSKKKIVPSERLIRKLINYTNEK